MHVDLTLSKGYARYEDIGSYNIAFIAGHGLRVVAKRLRRR